METIIASCISAGIALLVCVLNNNAQNAKTRALIEYRLSELEKKQDKHNDVIERTYHLEQSVAVLKVRVDDMQKGIDESHG